MFPFRFDVGYSEKYANEFEFYKDKTIDERVNLKLKDLKDRFSGWIYEPFDLKKDLNAYKDYMYNEFAYFYDYARDAIYYQSDNDDAISYYFEKKSINAKYQIKIKEKKTYELDIIGLSLRVFNSGVGILSIELENKETSDFDDILRINDFGRRIYPQYISMPSHFKFNTTKEQYFGSSTDATKGSFLADSIKIVGSYEKDKEKININTEEKFIFSPHDDIRVGSHIMELLGNDFCQNKEETKKEESEEESSEDNTEESEEGEKSEEEKPAEETSEDEAEESEEETKEEETTEDSEDKE